ncbi:unnamed protein product [Polarella glacialis]|uniref:Methyltransferase FkbM domain-containing protein n=1 Tax=Polarella glacialis TaxID=89957 RepID=A0A813IPG0_POLGL|nr:unnamed protein product [Polarella glacialis]
MLDGAEHTADWNDRHLLGEESHVVGLGGQILDSSEHDVIWYESSSFHTGNSLFKEDTAFFKDVAPTTKHANTVDNVLQKNVWNFQFNLLKIDVQGAELSVLSGASRALATVDAVLMEMPFAGVYNKGSPSFAQYAAFMDKLGFSPLDLTEVHKMGGVTVQIDFLWVRKCSRWPQMEQAKLQSLR